MRSPVEPTRFLVLSLIWGAGLLLGGCGPSSSPLVVGSGDGGVPTIDQSLAQGKGKADLGPTKADARLDPGEFCSGPEAKVLINGEPGEVIRDAFAIKAVPGACAGKLLEEGDAAVCPPEYTCQVFIEGEKRMMSMCSIVTSIHLEIGQVLSSRGSMAVLRGQLDLSRLEGQELFPLEFDSSTDNEMAVDLSLYPCESSLGCGAEWTSGETGAGLLQLSLEAEKGSAGQQVPALCLRMVNLDSSSKVRTLELSLPMLTAGDVSPF